MRFKIGDIVKMSKKQSSMFSGHIGIVTQVCAEKNHVYSDWKDESTNRARNWCHREKHLRLVRRPKGEE